MKQGFRLFWITGVMAAGAAALDAGVVSFELIGESRRWTQAHDVSYDGSVVVGICENQAFHWSEATGIEKIGALGGPNPQRSISLRCFR